VALWVTELLTLPAAGTTWVPAAVIGGYAVLLVLHERLYHALRLAGSVWKSSGEWQRRTC